MPSGRDLENKQVMETHNQIATPFGSCPYDLTQGDGQGTIGQGALQGPFASPSESGSTLRGKNFENWPQQSGGGQMWVPMDQTPALPVSGQSQGTGPKKGDISTAMSFPFGEIGGNK